MPSFGKHRPKPFMYFCLEWLERNPFAVYTDVTVFLIFGYDAISENLAVPDSWHIKELAVLHSEHHLYRSQATDVAVDANKIHVPVIRKSRSKEIGIGGHITHLGMISRME